MNEYLKLLDAKTQRIVSTRSGDLAQIADSITQKEKEMKVNGENAAKLVDVSKVYIIP